MILANGFNPHLPAYTAIRVANDPKIIGPNVAIIAPIIACKYLLFPNLPKIGCNRLKNAMTFFFMLIDLQIHSSGTILKRFLKC